MSIFAHLFQPAPLHARRDALIRQRRDFIGQCLDSFDWLMPEIFIANGVAQSALQPGNREMQRLKEFFSDIRLQTIARRQIVICFPLFSIREKISRLGINLCPLAEVVDIMID